MSIDVSMVALALAILGAQAVLIHKYLGLKRAYDDVVLLEQEIVFISSLLEHALDELDCKRAASHELSDALHAMIAKYGCEHSDCAEERAVLKKFAE